MEETNTTTNNTTDNPVMEKRVSDIRVQIKKEDLDPNFVSGLDAWDMAKDTFEELTDKESSEFIRTWYKMVTRSMKAATVYRKEAETTNGKGRRTRGFDKHGRPTNASIAGRMEEYVETLWAVLLKYAASKNKKTEKAVTKIHQNVLKKAEEIRVRDEAEKAKKDAERAAKAAA